MTPQYLLAADVGGTKTEIAYGYIEQGKLAVLARRVYPSQEYAKLESLIDDFASALKANGHSVPGSAACLAVAGPVMGNSASLTNVHWQIEGAVLAVRYGLCAVRLINDFEAVGYGLAHLSADELLNLQPGQRVTPGTRVAVGAGTGLGVALLTHSRGRYTVHPSEAGHMDFAPADAAQDDLLAWLRRELGHVSYERVLSGSGLVRVFRFLLESGYGLPSTALEEAMQAEEPPGAISRFGLEGRDPLAARALDVFVQVYGAYAGNIALAVLAHGGVYIAGGIAPKIAAKLQDGRFIEAFLHKGRFDDLLSTIPVDVVMNPAVGLYGAFEVANQAAADAAT
ncbi:MAG TPA: glucokinase [Burkholderiales bacterium]|jgi:glucokinase, proteobacterial type